MKSLFRRLIDRVRASEADWIEEICGYLGSRLRRKDKRGLSFLWGRRIFDFRLFSDDWGSFGEFPLPLMALEARFFSRIESEMTLYGIGLRHWLRHLMSYNYVFISKDLVLKRKPVVVRSSSGGLRYVAFGKNHLWIRHSPPSDTVQSDLDFLLNRFGRILVSRRKVSIRVVRQRLDVAKFEKTVTALDKVANYIEARI